MKVQIEIDEQMIEDLFITAFEGGSSYWAEVKDITPKGDKTSQSERWFHHLWRMDGAMRIYDVEDGDLLGTLTKAKMINGLQLMAKESPDQFGNMLNEEGDAWTADIWLQLSLMDEIVYG